MESRLLTETEALGLKDSFHTPFPVINAVLSGKQDGKIYSIQNCFFVLHKSGFAYCRAAGPDVDYNKLVEFLFLQNDLPQYFHIYDAHPVLCEAFIEDDKNVKVKMRKRVQLKFPVATLPAGATILPAEFYMERVTANNFSALTGFNLQLGNKFWSSAEDFLQNGFGFAIFAAGGQAVSICYAASVAGNVAEIDVATVAAYRQKGFAKKAVREFLNHCIQNNISANWDCFEDNIGSLNTAKSLGFERVKAYNFLSIYKVISA